MAYADQKMSGGKVVAIVIVALIHLALGYAFITGLAYQYVKKATEKLNTFDVEEPPPPPPPDEPPPPPQDVPLQPPPVVSPPPIVPPVTPPPVVIQTVPTPPPVQVLTPIAAPPAPPAPPAVRVVSQRASLKGDLQRYFTADDYPSDALRSGAAGRTVVSLAVGPDGRVTNCTVSSSSGTKSLDDTTCRIARSRVRYTPAKDDAGQPVASTTTLPVSWRAPDE